MPSPAASTDPRSRDRLLVRVRRASRILVAGAEDLPDGADPDDLGDLGWYATQEIPDLLG
jgi:hypothetical protein